MDIFTQAELEIIVGYKSKKRIIKWLEKHRIPFLIAANGRPLVNKQALAHVMGGSTENKRDIELNFDVEGFRK